MNPDTTPTPRTYQLLASGKAHYMSRLCRQLERELAEKTNEVARLKEMVMDAAKRGDKLAEHWKGRAEKAEAIIKQLHNFAETLETRIRYQEQLNHNPNDKPS